MKLFKLRNLIGGILGGIIGILLSWYVTPIFMPLGILICVTIGWYNEMLIEAIRS